MGGGSGCWYISRRDLVLVGGVLDDEEAVKVCCGWDDDEAWLLGEEDVVRCEGDKGGERWWLGGEVVRLE